jgi:hypothetical protein
MAEPFKYFGAVPQRKRNPKVEAAFTSVDERIAAFKAASHSDRFAPSND